MYIILKLFIIIIDVVLKAVQSIPEQDRFRSSPSVLSTAIKLIDWMKNGTNEKEHHEFCHKLVMKMRECFQYDKLRLNKEKLWGLYHRMRTSEDFIKLWSDFMLSSVTVADPSPFFYQYVSTYVMKELIKKDHPVLSEASHASAKYEVSLTPLEQNSLRYVCGYVCRKIRDRAEAKQSSFNAQLVLGLMELAGDELCDENTEEWTNKVDRGGLWHINDETYDLFSAMEFETKGVLRAIGSAVGKSNDEESVKKKIKDAITQNSDILFKWCLLSSEMDDTVASVLFNEIIDLYITIRGFAFASGCIETFKQAHKQTLQKKKALRKGLK